MREAESWEEVDLRNHHPARPEGHRSLRADSSLTDREPEDLQPENFPHDVLDLRPSEPPVAYPQAQLSESQDIR